MKKLKTRTVLLLSFLPVLVAGFFIGACSGTLEVIDTYKAWWRKGLDKR